MRDYLQNHKGQIYTATSLAAALGWKNEVVVSYKDKESGEIIRNTVFKGWRAKTARRCAVAAGASATKGVHAWSIVMS